jgi:hypothetical protein
MNIVEKVNSLEKTEQNDEDGKRTDDITTPLV